MLHAWGRQVENIPITCSIPEISMLALSIETMRQDSNDTFLYVYIPAYLHLQYIHSFVYADTVIMLTQEHNKHTNLLSFGMSLDK